MKGIKDVTLVNVLELVEADEVRNKAIQFWKKHKAIVNEAVLNQRASELLMVAYDDDMNVIATSTGVKSRVKLLNNNWLYQYRCFIDPDFRVIGFDYHITQSSLNALEVAAGKDEDKPIGVFLVLENPNLYNNKVNNAAVWRAYKMYFIGFNTKGQPIRVYYFKDALI